MNLLDLCDDVLEIVVENLAESRKQIEIRYWKNAYIPSFAVLKCWELGAAHQVRYLNLHTNGAELFSYDLKIGFTDAGTRYLLDYTAPGKAFVRETTSTHVNKAREYADKVIKV